MKVIEYHDRDGFKQKSLVKNGQSDPAKGIPISPPDVRGLDWDVIRKRLHELLLNKELLTLADTQARPDDLMWCIKAAIAKPLLQLYQEIEQ